MNAQKLTQKALEAIQTAQNIAIENQNIQILPEHLFYALLDGEDGLVTVSYTHLTLPTTSRV